VRICVWWRQRSFERTTGPSSRSEGRRDGGLRPKATWGTWCGADAEGSEGLAGSLLERKGGAASEGRDFEES
jgi:hypothetical protein